MPKSALDLRRFSQGNEPPLNLTEKVNRVVMDRMRAARNNPKEEPHDQKIREPKGPKHIRKVKGSETPPKSVPEVTAKDAPANISNELAGTEGLGETTFDHSATQLDPPTIQRSPESVPTTEDSGPRAKDQKQSKHSGSARGMRTNSKRTFLGTDERSETQTNLKVNQRWESALIFNTTFNTKKKLDEPR